MATPFKDYLSEEFLSVFADEVLSTYPSFQKNVFLKTLFDPSYKDLELKERMRKISTSIHDFLPIDFQTSIDVLIQAQNAIARKKLNPMGLELIFVPDFIEVFGIDHFKESIDAMEKVTPVISCEFCVRPFIIKYEDQMLDVLMKWSKHKNEHLRRLASEGCRPRLPWAIALPKFKKDPSPILPILENLKNDTSEYVRRSVANNLNDIAKDHPELTLSISKKWQGTSAETDVLVKHALRTLLKTNYPGAMQLIGYSDSNKLSFSSFKIHSKNVKIGESVHFSFDVKNDDQEPFILRMEYAIYYLLKNGKNAKKVFKISERTLKPKEAIHMDKKHSFKIITTRTYYPGKHYVSVILNGIEQEKTGFVISELSCLLAHWP